MNAVRLERDWWERSSTLLLLALITSVPLLGPELPPLLDLPGHLVRYKASVDLPDSPALQQFYSFNWVLVGNLGGDLLVRLLAPVLGLEPAARLVVTAIPPLTVAGVLLVAREIHGRVPPTALFAVPLAFGFPFNLGFVNFTLAMALAFLAFAWWLRLGRLGLVRLRALVFVPLSLLIWLAHTYGWLLLGILCLAGDVAVPRAPADPVGASWSRRALRAVFRTLPLAAPLPLAIGWTQGGEREPLTGWFQLADKAAHLFTILRDRWLWLDLSSAVLLAALVVFAWRSRRFSFSRRLGVAALLVALLSLLMPSTMYGSGYADRRFLPYLAILLLIAIRPGASAGRFSPGIALAAMAFIAVRIGGNTASYLAYGRSFERELSALEHIPRGARLVSFVGKRCGAHWMRSRLDHLPGMAAVRREAFSNEQWQYRGVYPIKVVYREAGEFAADPSQIVRPGECRRPGGRTLDESLRQLPRGAFDYLWLIDPPPFDRALSRDFEPVWSNGSSVLYRLPKRQEGALPGLLH